MDNARRGIVVLLLTVLLGCSGKPDTPSPISQSDGDSQKTPPLKTVSPQITQPDNEPAPTVETKPSPTKPVSPPADDLDKQKLVTQLTNDDEAVREAAEQALRDLGPEAVPYLLWGMKHTSAETRAAAIYFALEKFDSDDSRLPTAFIDALTNDDLKTRKLALIAVQRMDEKTLIQALPNLSAMLSNSNELALNRRSAINLIGKMKIGGGSALPALLRGAKDDPDGGIRAACAYSASQVLNAKQAKSAAIALAVVLEDDEEKVRLAASKSLLKIGAASVEPLIQRLASSKPQTRQVTLYTLGKLNAVAKPALPAIEKLTQDQDEDVAKLAAAVLRHIKSSK